MPTLPTFTVTDAVATRLMKAFSGQLDENGQPLTPAQAYKRWLRSSLIERVTRSEAEVTNKSMEGDLPL